MTNSVNQLFKQIVATHKKTSKPKKKQKNTRKPGKKHQKKHEQTSNVWAIIRLLFRTVRYHYNPI